MLVDGLTHLSGADFNYDIAFSTLSTPTDGAVLGRFQVPRSFTIPAGATGSSAESLVAPTAAASYPIKKDGVQVGTFDFALGVNTTTMTFASASAFVAGDLLTVEAPATADATHDSIAFVIKTVAT